MMMPMFTYDYVAGDNLSTSTGRGHVYRLDLAGTPESVLRNAAAFFGVSGETQKSQYFDAAWPSYVVGPEDGSAPSITVSWSGTGSWWYNNPAAYPEQKCLKEKRVGKGSDAYIECTEYEPAVMGLNPDETKTRQLASEFFAEMGVEANDSDALALLCLSALYGQAGKLDKIVELLGKHEAKMGNNVHLANNYFEALFQTGQLDKVTRLLNALAGTNNKEVKQFAIQRSQLVAQFLQQQQQRLAATAKA
jgi:hypothetical protein